MHTRGSQLVPELLLKLSDTLHIQYRYIEHVHEEVSCKKKYLLAKWLLIYNLAILYDMCIDSRATENRFFAGPDRFLVCKTDSVCIKRIFFGP